MGESLNDDKHELGSYNQFANKTTTYREENYTTMIDQSRLTKEMVDKAERIEREINNQDSKGNKHLAQERGQMELADNEDEEMLHSAVIRRKNFKKFSCINKTKKADKKTLGDYDKIVKDRLK